VSIELEESETKYYKFIPSTLDPIEFDMNTLSGFASFTIST